MDNELSVIDGILNNLAGIQSFLEFEYAHYKTLHNITTQFQKESCEIKELKQSNEIFLNESNKEIEEINTKLVTLEKKIKEIEKEICIRQESKKKLMDLFEALKSVDKFEDATTSKKSLDKSQNDNHLTDELPIIEIREELDDDDTVIRSEVKPYNLSENNLKELIDNKISQMEQEELRKTDSEKVIAQEVNVGNKESRDENIEDDSTSGFRPFVIREEIDEDGNIIKSSVSRIPKMDKTKEEDEAPEISPTTFQDSNIEEIKEEESEEVDDKQLEELFEDMGFVTKTTNDEPDGAEPENETHSENSSYFKVPLNDTQPEKDTVSVSDPSYSTSNTYPIDTEDLYTLQLISEELNSADEEQFDDSVNENFNEDEDEDFEWPEIDGDIDENEETSEEDDEIQKRSFYNMYGSKAHNLFAQQIQNLRAKNTDITDDNMIKNVTLENIETKEEVIEIDNKHKSTKKKSVSFNNSVDVKQVDDIWDDLRRSNAENEINDILKKQDNAVNKSYFKSERMNDGKKIDSDLKIEESGPIQPVNVMNDVLERQVIESDGIVEHHARNVFKTFDSNVIRKQVDDSLEKISKETPLTKISGKKGPSRFKLARIAETGKKFQETHITNETREELQKAAENFIKNNTEKTKSTDTTKPFKSNLNSLKPNASNHQKSQHIETPVDINPLPANPSMLDEDYEIIRNEITDDIFDDDDEMIENEFTVSETIRENDVIFKEDVQEPKKIEPFFPKYDKSDKNLTEVVDTQLDYKTLGDDLDTMAKAYVLGLYDDDIETVGEVIEQVDDFENHNKIVEEKNENKLHDRVEEINRTLEKENSKIEEIIEDNDPMVMTDIVENSMDEILSANSIPDDQLDIELNDENLTTQVALDYTKMRSNMIHKYKGGFKETDKEKEFVRPEGSERVSRFKAARLGM